MGAMESAQFHWDFLAAASTGGLKAVNARGRSERFTAYYEAGPGTTGTVRLETRSGSSSGPYATISGTSTAVSTSGVAVFQFAGPLEWVRPYCAAKTTGTLSVDLLGN